MKNKLIGTFATVFAVIFTLALTAVGVLVSWISVQWLFSNVFGIDVLGLCARAGLAGEIIIILAPFVAFGMAVFMLYNPCFTDMC
jgi:hypothetical protein